jgi:hypothetical protein
MQQVRSDSRTGETIAKISDMCEEARPGASRVVVAIP